MESEEREDEDVSTEDVDEGTGEAKGALDADDPERGEGTGEGERGLGEQPPSEGGAEQSANSEEE